VDALVTVRLSATNTLDGAFVKVAVLLKPLLPVKVRKTLSPLVGVADHVDVPADRLKVPAPLGVFSVTAV
jgi:hypothetical protein